MSERKVKNYASKAARSTKTGRFVTQKSKTKPGATMPAGKTRQSIRDAATDAEKRFKGSMKLLA